MSSSSSSTCHPHESLFWSHFASLSAKSTNNIDFSAHHHHHSTNNNNNKYLPPWLKDQTLPFLNEEGIKQVAAVLHAGVAFRNTLNEVAESKRGLKQQLEVRHLRTVEELENTVEKALRDGNRHEFVANVKKFRDEIERFRTVISELETSLSSSSSSSSSTNGTDEHRQLLISKARDTFNSLCQDLAENWKSKYSLNHTRNSNSSSNHSNDGNNNASCEKDTTRKTSLSPIHQSPPWQLFYSAESDPFSPPSTEESKVTFDGGRILDRFGRDVWEDRCYALGVTIQSGVSVGVGVERYRSANRKNCTRSGLWQRWSSSVSSSWITSSTSSISEDDGKNCDDKNNNNNEIEFQICSSSSSPNSTSSCCTCRIIDPFKNDHFVKCNNQRVMSFIEISEKIDKLITTTSSSSSSSSSSSNQNRNNFNDRLRLATIESFKAYKNFPFLMPRLVENNDNADIDSNFALTQLLKSAYLTYGQVERLICRTIDLIAKRMFRMNNASSSAPTSTTNNTGNNNNNDGETESIKTDQVSRSSIRCIAGLIEDPFLFFIVDIACVCLGVCFVGLHTSWSQDDIHRALHEIVKPDLIISDNNLRVLQESATEEYSSSVSGKAIPDLPKMKITSQELLSAAPTVADDDEKTTSLLETTVNAYLKQGLFHGTLLHDKYHFNIFETNTSANSDSSLLQRPFTLMFSSGTSGNLKAVEVPSENWLQTNFKQQRYELDPFSVVSFNAMAHGLDRGLCWTALFSAGRVCFVQQQSVSSSSTTNTDRTKTDETWMKNQKRKIGERILRAVNMSVKEDSSSSSFLSACEQLLPDFIVATRICSPSLVVASPDLWTSLFTLLNKIVLINTDEDGEHENCSTFLQKLSVLQNQVEKGETTSFNFFENRLLLSQQRSPQKSTTQTQTQKILVVQKIIHTLFGPNFRQGATGAAPVSPQVVEFFQNLFSPSYFIDIDADVPRSLRTKKLLEKQQNDEKSDEQTRNNNNNDNSVGVFYDVYGATEAPGISTNHTLRSGLDIALAKVSGYELLSSSSISSTSSSSSIICHCFGELLVRGSGVARKYRNDEKSSNEAFLENGWYRTGDVVKLEITIAKDDEDDVNHKNDDERTRLKMMNRVFEQRMLANDTCLHIVKKQLLSSKTKLFVVDRVKDLIELYVDHQSVWVPASKVEELMMMTTSTDDDKHSSTITLENMNVKIEQVAVFGDRMLPFMVAVVGLSLSSDAVNIGNNTNVGESSVVADLETKLLQLFAERIRNNNDETNLIKDYWIPKRLLLYKVDDDHYFQNDDEQLQEQNDDGILLPKMEKWIPGGEYRTHLGKLRRGILGKHLRNDLAKVFSSSSS